MYTATSYCEAGDLPLEELLALQDNVVNWIKKTQPKRAKKAR